MKKQKEIKIRRTWDRHPAERIKETKTESATGYVCELCGLYKTEPTACNYCEFDNPAQEIGNA